MKQFKRIITIIMTLAILGQAALGGAFWGDNPIQAEAAGRPVAITSCLISGSDVVCEITASSVPASDDGKFYIYADEVYQDGPAGIVVAKVDAGRNVSAGFPLNYNTDESNLSRKFLVA